MKAIKRSDIINNGAILVGIDPGMVCTAIVEFENDLLYDTGQNMYNGIPTSSDSYKNNIYGALTHVYMLALSATPESIFVVEDSRKRSGKKEAAYGAGAVNAVTTAIVQILEDREVNFILRKAGGPGNEKRSKEFVFEHYGVKLRNQHEADAFMCAIREVQVI